MRGSGYICWLRLYAVLLYAFQLVHALLIFLDQTINVVLELTDFCEFGVETRLKFGVCFAEVLFTVLDYLWLYGHHLDF